MRVKLRARPHGDRLELAGQRSLSLESYLRSPALPQCVVGPGVESGNLHLCSVGIPRFSGIVFLRQCRVVSSCVLPGPALRKLRNSAAPPNFCSQLQDTRQTEFYERMVAHLMAQIFYQENREIFSENIFCRHTTRPWGRRKSPVRMRNHTRSPKTR